MGRTVAIGIQNFEKIIKGNYFYVDKTSFIKEWWESGDDVTLITRPRRFGKTLNMSMVECFFPVQYEGRDDLFEGLSIWNEDKYKKLQGSYPVIYASFAGVKETNYQQTRKRINRIIKNLYSKYMFLSESDKVLESDKEFLKKIVKEEHEIDEVDAAVSIYQLAKMLQQYYEKKVIILLDEYDTPLQEAYINGFWDELAAWTRSLFNSTFKTNPYMERGIMTGITHISKESIFSDLNNLEVITTTSDRYAKAFGFTEEVFAVLDEYGLGAEKDGVKGWYDGFVFGKCADIYNP